MTRIDALRTIGGYRLIASLGDGGMGHVFLGVSNRTVGFHKLLVLKVLRPELEAEPDIVKSFLSEAQIAARLNHPNVVQTYEIGSDEGMHFLAMEYLEGQALSTIYSKVGRADVPMDVQLRVLCDLLEGLDYAHELKDYDGTPLQLVHRDVSPHNVFATYSGVSKLLDFGIARVTGMTRTQDGVIKGKIGYMSPEQLCGMSVDRRADVFAVGVMLWEALAGRRISEARERDMTIMSRRVAGTEPKVRVVRPDVAPELADICDRAMAPHPEERFATATEMRAAIEAYAQPRGLLADRRTLAAFLTKHFAGHREQLMRRIDAHIKSAPPSGPMLRLGTAPTGSTDSRSRDALEQTKLEHTSDRSGAPTPSEVGLRRAVLYLGVSLTMAIASAAFFALRPREAPRPTNEQTAERSPPTEAKAVPGAPASPSSEPTSAPVQPAPAPPAVVHLRVRVTPAGASVTLDGSALRVPADLTVPRDEAATHVVEAKLAGFASQTRSLRATGDEDVEIKLAPLGRPAGAAERPKPAASVSAPIRDIEQDPYK